MPSPSKAKGSSWEREIAKFLSDLYDESFIRTPSSGAYVGGSNASRRDTLHEAQVRNFKGDIVPPPEWHFFNAEAKFYKDFAWHQLLTGKCSQLDLWIQQQYQAADNGDFNIMFLKFNRQGKYVAIEHKHLSKLRNLSSYTTYSSKATKSKWILCEFDEFFQHNADMVKTQSARKVYVDGPNREKKTPTT